MTDGPRKLATIVALDVAWYSARTEADEAKTTAEVGGRPMRPNAGAVRGARSTTVLSYVFARAESRALRADPRFASFCARVGRVNY